MSRISERFTKLKAEGRTGLVTFTVAGDPDLEKSYEIFEQLPDAGVDFIELGMPFSDPMADGPAIQLASGRALDAGMTVVKILDMVRRFREKNNETPVILMGYYNPIYIYGVDRFLEDAKEAGIDGLIIVDLPPEEDKELCLPAQTKGIAFIRLITPTTDEKRLKIILKNSSGFLYYVAVTGVTGGKSAKAQDIGQALDAIRQNTDLPVVVGFGIKTPDDVTQMAQYADAVVVGSAIVEKDPDDIISFVTELSTPLKG